jgi:photosystem II stability/assembly factor-like uncharacterized protein
MKNFMNALILVFATCSILHSQTEWFVLNTGNNYKNNCVYFVNNLSGYIGTSNSVILKTTNGGINWSSITIEPYDDVKINSIVFVNQNTGIAVGGYNEFANGKSYRTTNAGLNWTLAFTFGLTQEDVAFPTVTSGYCVGSNVISKTINGGGHWSSQFSYSFGNLLCIEFLDANSGFAAGTSDDVLKTTNGGILWTAASLLGSGLKYDIHFPSPSTGYVSCSNGRVMKTLNGGLNWFSIPVLGITDKLYSVYFTSTNTGYVVGEGGTLVQTTNGGDTWEANLPPTFQTLNSVFFVSSLTGYAVGNGGTAIKTTNGGGSFSGIGVNVTCAFEGLYYQLFNVLSRRDTLTAYLASANSPYLLVDSAKCVIDSTNFSGLLNFTNAQTGNYYLVLKQFQSVQTWSKAGGESLIRGGNIYSYDFTTSSSQAYGSNLRLKGGKYCIYTGDINQSGFIDGSDAIRVHSDSQIFLTGRFLITDLNGDNIVDGTDYLIVDNNAFNFIGTVRP